MELSPKKALALCMLLAGHSTEEIAEALGISSSGVAKIKREEDFKQALRQAVNEVYSRAIGELASGALAFPPIWHSNYSYLFTIECVLNFMVNLLAGLVAYTYQEKKPSLDINPKSLPALPAAAF